MPLRKVPSKDELQQLYDAGLSTREIAIRLALNINTVGSALSRYGILSRTPKETKALQKARGVVANTGKYWQGKKQPAEMVEKRISKIRGDKHWSWKGGTESRLYRKVGIKKETCERCPSTESLLIHHKDFDHFNDSLDNLQVLCKSCHSSIHKKAYWDAIHAGKEPPKSNAPIHWKS